MYLCNCNGIKTHEAIRAIEETNAERPKEVFAACGGTKPQCGKCIRDFQGLIDVHKAMRPQPDLKLTG